MRALAIGLILFYRRFVSPHVGGCCLYTPTCSEYAIASIGRYGVVLGARLTLRRLLRCRPPYGGGHDPVPAHDQIGDAMRGGLVLPSGRQAFIHHA